MPWKPTQRSGSVAPKDASLCGSVSSLLKKTRALLQVRRQRRSWTMGTAAAGALMIFEAVHIRRPPAVTFVFLVSWRMCAAGQVGPVVHMCAGKARRI
jgi:hypothetical protein